MTSKLIAGIALSLLSVSALAQQDEKGKESNAHVGVIFPISTNGTDAIDYHNKFSLHLIGGVSRSEESVCLSGLGSYIKENAGGLVASGAANVIGGDVEGAALAGFTNYIGGYTTGLQAAGFTNVSEGVYGVQAAGFTNVSLGDIRGVQGAGFVNMANGVDGLQAAGFVNFNLNSTKGLQGAGFVNVSKDIEGAQVAGFVNAGKSVSGFQGAGFVNVAENVNTQIAGFINVAKRVKGVQAAGFINIAEKSDYPIGLVNISKEGEKCIGITMDDNLTNLVTFRSGGKYLYGIVGAGSNFRYSVAMYGLEGGIGAHIPISKHFRFNTELTLTTLTDFWNTVEFYSSARILPALIIGDRVEIFAGPAYSHSYVERNTFTPLRSNYIYKKDYQDHTYKMYIGALAGIQFHI